MPKKTETAEKASKSPKKQDKPAGKTAGKKAVKEDEAQPMVNIGLIGHVDHGKTTLTERLSGKWTDTHSEELKRGITIRLGYADTIIRKCSKCKGAETYTVKEKCEKCGGPTEFVRKISFIDAPGHESLMATMLSGATIMDGALLIVAANESCPQPQTSEHLMALEIIGIKNIIVVQNKIDLVKKEQALKNRDEIRKFLSNTSYKDAPIIPISAKHNLNIDILLDAIENQIPTPKRDDTKNPMMFIARSFDINKPGAKPDELVGGIIGGAVVQGKLKVGDEISMRPGRKIEKENKITYEPIRTHITALKTGGGDVESVKPGGSIGLLTALDPAIVKSDSLVGNVVGHKGKLPPVWEELDLETHLLKRVVGAKDDLVVEPIKKDEILMLNVNSAATVGFVTELYKEGFKCRLKLSVSAEPGSRVTISRRVANRFRLIGYGIIKE
ncbi:translation initiation factor IF-2 subunit gamma [Candidatus Woesearchaeota archaeon]|nr:translation initiation factor IF-2 subunit gamma [Candidatus Woesearchaeota archaeon]